MSLTSDWVNLRQSTPAKRQSTPAKRQSTPAKRQPTPAKRQPTPAKRQPTPAKRQPTPAKRQSTPAKRQSTTTSLLASRIFIMAEPAVPAKPAKSVEPKDTVLEAITKTAATLARAQSIYSNESPTIIEPDPVQIDLDGLRKRFLLTFIRPDYKKAKGSSPKTKKVYNDTVLPYRVYMTALQKGSHFFLTFVACVTPRMCKDKGRFQHLFGTPIPNFGLDEASTTLFLGWASADGYANMVAFTDFLSVFTNIGMSSAGQLRQIRRIISECGSEGIPQPIIDILKSNAPQLTQYPQDALKHPSHISTNRRIEYKSSDWATCGSPTELIIKGPNDFISCAEAINNDNCPPTNRDMGQSANNRNCKVVKLRFRGDSSLLSTHKRKSAQSNDLSSVTSLGIDDQASDNGTTATHNEVHNLTASDDPWGGWHNYLADNENFHSSPGMTPTTTHITPQLLDMTHPTTPESTIPTPAATPPLQFGHMTPPLAEHQNSMSQLLPSSYFPPIILGKRSSPTLDAEHRLKRPRKAPSIRLSPKSENSWRNLQSISYMSPPGLMSPLKCTSG